MPKINLPLKTKIYLLPAGIGIFILATTLLILRPWYQAARDIATQAQVKETKLSEVKRKIDRLSTVNPAQVTSQLKSIEAAVPPTKDVVSAITTIKQAAINSGALISSLRLSPGGLTSTASTSAQPEVENNQIKYTVSLEAVREQFSAFVAAFNQFTPLITLDQISSTEDKGLLTITANLSSFLIPQSTVDLGSADSQLAILTSDEEALLNRFSSLSPPFVPVSESAPTTTAPIGKPNPFSP